MKHNFIFPVRMSRKDASYWLHSAITIVIMFGFGYLPPMAPITALGMKILGVFFAMLYGWTFVDQIWPSILGMIALSTSGYASLKALMAGGFGDNTVLLMFFMLIIVSLVEEAGVSKFIAIYFVSRKFVLGRPWVFIATFFFVSFLISAMTSTVPAIVVCWGILYSICKQFGYKPGDSFTTFSVVGVVYSCLIGLAVLPWKTVQMVVLGLFEQATGANMDYLDYVCITLPVSIVCMVAYILLGRFFFKPDVERLRGVTFESFDPEDLKINRQQKFILFLLVMLVVMLLAPSFLPAGWGVIRFLKGLGAHGVAMLIMGILILVRSEGKPMLNFRHHAGRMQWDSVFLTAALMPFSGALNAPEAGINAFLVEKFGLLLNGVSETAFLLIVMLCGILLTQVMNNAICGGILFPIVYPFAVAMGMNPGKVTVLLIFVLVMAVVTPAASPMAALMFSNTEWVSTKDCYQYILPGIVIVFLAAVVVGIPIASVVF